MGCRADAGVSAACGPRAGPVNGCGVPRLADAVDVQRIIRSGAVGPGLGKSHGEGGAGHERGIRHVSHGGIGSLEDTAGCAGAGSGGVPAGAQGGRLVSRRVDRTRLCKIIRPPRGRMADVSHVDGHRQRLPEPFHALAQHSPVRGIGAGSGRSCQCDSKRFRFPGPDLATHIVSSGRGEWIRVAHGAEAELARVAPQHPAIAESEMSRDGRAWRHGGGDVVADQFIRVISPGGANAEVVAYAFVGRPHGGRAEKIVLQVKAVAVTGIVKCELDQDGCAVRNTGLGLVAVGIDGAAVSPGGVPIARANGVHDRVVYGSGKLLADRGPRGVFGACAIISAGAVRAGGPRAVSVQSVAVQRNVNVRSVVVRSQRTGAQRVRGFACAGAKGAISGAAGIHTARVAILLDPVAGGHAPPGFPASAVRAVAFVQAAVNLRDASILPEILIQVSHNFHVMIVLTAERRAIDGPFEDIARASPNLAVSRGETDRFACQGRTRRQQGAELNARRPTRRDGWSGRQVLVQRASAAFDADRVFNAELGKSGPHLRVDQFDSRVIQRDRGERTGKTDLCC